MTIDFAAPAMRDDRRRTQLEDPPLGGGFQPMFGEQRLIAVVNGAHAWDVVGDNAMCPASATTASRTSPAARPDLDDAARLHQARDDLDCHGANRDGRGARKTIVVDCEPRRTARFEGTLNDQTSSNGSNAGSAIRSSATR